MRKRLVGRVASHRYVTDGFDQATKLAVVDILSGRCSGRVIDQLLIGRAMGAIHVVGSELKRNLTYLDPLDHPVGLDVIEVLQHQARDREHAQIIETGCPAAIVELVAVRMERQRNEGVEARRALLRFTKTNQVVDAIFKRLDLSVEHGRVGSDALAMQLFVDREPVITVDFVESR